MPNVSPQVESALAQMDQFGDDEDAFKAYMTVISPFIRAYVDEGKFRNMARSMWLSDNKGGLKKLITSVAEGPTLAEQEKELQEELLQAKKALEYLISVQIGSMFASMGFRRGDVLTVQGSNGQQRNIVFDGNLPELDEDFAEWAERALPEEAKAKLAEMFPDSPLVSRSGQIGQ